MKIYRVGGSVRDELLGLPVTDRDFVVVGSTPEAMRELGFQPVGRDFPVFLHPQTHDEYALARTERKHGRGHQGFVFHADPDVTLEADLLRRDLTINAMAMDETGVLIDPYGGQRDLASRTLRHVSPAFGEDPLRVLRVARFAARFGFDVAEQTEALMRELVARGELRDLSPERVWQEFASGLVARQPSRMLAVLRRCGALREFAPEIDGLFGAAGARGEPDLGVATALALDRGAAAGDSPRLAVQFGITCRHLTLAQAVALGARLKVSADCRDAALNAIRHGAALERAADLSAAEWLALLAGLDALRRPERLDVQLSIQSFWRGREPEGKADPEQTRTLAKGALQALNRIVYPDAAPASSEGIGERVRQLRLAALEEWRAGMPAQD
ncbi:MAG: multifunctional CCA tRNA nucleotidyl transferase/2'3'-cyclic phosphodiesterase/2'nucleotidase/phosphatase [Betaproteobacteria bacterium]|nr:multifunctional CCA tRNA nucleotidyl transferase/2'3'-cyclic phosphodiesterase/2'nucleotidase/phosphatase [Betaproteobacteria bacterium]